jgi:hypothetical protein
MNTSQPDYTEKYLESMSNKERRAYEIAKHHLQTSFDLQKSIGYKKFVKKLTESSPPAKTGAT